MDFSQQHVPRSAAETLREMAEAAEKVGYDFDTYGDGASLRAFEDRVAGLFGKEAGLFVATGTMAQQNVLRCLTWGCDVQMNPKIYVHPTSHLIHQDCLRDGEAQGKVFTRRAATNLGEFDVVAMGQFDRVLQWRDLIVKFYLPGATVNAAVVLELPQRMNGGGTPSWDDLVEISTYLRGKRVKLHMDGARLFEVLPYYGKPLEELAALFDTVYVSFYKGVGALASAMVLGPRDVLDAVRAQVSKRGGKLFTLGPLALSAELAFDASGAADGAFAERFDRIKAAVAVVKAEAEASGVRVEFDPEEPQSAMVHCYLKGDRAELERLHEKAKERTGATLWNKFRGEGHKGAGWSYFEWSMGPANAAFSDDDVRAAWAAFLDLCKVEHPLSCEPDPVEEVDPEDSPEPLKMEALKTLEQNMEANAGLEDAAPPAPDGGGGGDGDAAAAPPDPPVAADDDAPVE